MPIDVFLDHCQLYSSINLQIVKHKIKDYNVQLIDIEDQVFIAFTNVPDIDVNMTVESSDTKIYNDLAFFNGK